MIQAVLFDMDGLMFDTERLWGTFWEPALGAFGLRYKDGLEEEARGTAGETMRALLRRYYGPDCPVEGILERFHALARETFAKPVPKKPGLDELLAWLNGRGIPMGVVSSSGEALIRRNLDNWGLGPYFKVIVSGEAAARLSAEGVCPQVICVDPPRKGLAPEVPEVLASMAPERIVYVSCDPATLARDVKRFGALGYQAEQAQAVDLFPRTQHVETVVLLGRKFEKSREHVYLDYEPSAEIDLPGGATYSEIKQWIQAEYDLKVSSLYVAQVKQKHGIVERECYNKPKSENAKQPKCPPEKEAAITEALKHFGMI